MNDHNKNVKLVRNKKNTSYAQPLNFPLNKKILTLI